jgi:hypothetical protein
MCPGCALSLDPPLAAVGFLADEILVMTMEDADGVRCRAGRQLPGVDLALDRAGQRRRLRRGATGQRIGQSKPAWFIAMLLLPPVAIAYWLWVRPQLRAAARGS